MYRTILASLATAAALGFTTAPAGANNAAASPTGTTPRTPTPEEHVALFKNVSGSVTVLRGAAPVEAAPGMPLFVADRVVSAAGASAGIVFKDGTTVALGPASEVALRDYVFEPKEARYQFDLYLARGKAVYSSGKIGKLAPEMVKVGTPTATVGVRGTRFIVEAE